MESSFPTSSLKRFPHSELKASKAAVGVELRGDLAQQSVSPREAAASLRTRVQSIVCPTPH
jgi:hypothetical protein